MEIIFAMTTIVVILTISAGIYLVYKGIDDSKKQLKKMLKWNLSVFIPLLIFSIVTLIPDAVQAANEAAATGSGSGLGYIAAALSTGMATIGAGYAVGVVGSSALGAVSEDSSIMGRTLIFVGLAEGIAIYGLIISIMILGRL